MKRELAFALEARSQFSGFIGRTRSSKSPPPQFPRRKAQERSSNDRSKISIDEVNMSRRSKRVKTAIPDADLINVDGSKDEEDSSAAEVAKGEEEPAAAEVAMGEEEPVAAEVVKGEEKTAAAEVSKGEEESAAAEVAVGEEESLDAEAAKGGEESATAEAAKGELELAVVEAAKGEEEGTRRTRKVYVSRRKYRKDKVNSSSPKRLTRSALKETEENVEEPATPNIKKLELKMSKKIGLDRMPTNMRELLETGLLEGFPVFYNLEGRKLQGVIKGSGIVCSCSLCMGAQVIAPSKFELHACDQYRHAIKFICLDNGKSLLEVLEICKSSASEPLEVALQTVISSLPVKPLSTCTNNNSLIEFEPPSSTRYMFKRKVLKKGKQVLALPATNEHIRTSSHIPKASSSTILAIKAFPSAKLPNKSSPSTILAIKATPKTRLPKKASPSAKLPNKASPSTKLPNMASPSTSLSIFSVKKRGPGRPRKSDSVLNSPKSASNKRKARRLKMFRSPRPTPAEKATLLQTSGKKLTIKNQQWHWAVFEEGGLPDGTELTYVTHGKKLLDGYKIGRGILCSCCKTEVSASQFEAHAGWASRKKPYENIYMSNGVSLHEYAVSLKIAENRRCPVKFNDDLCRICWDGGNLLLCDGCPRSYHQECIKETSVPRGRWYCRYCRQAMKIDGESENAIIAGRIEGIDLIEQITSRCIRIVKTPENIDLVACVLCRGHDFSKTVFNDRTVIVCDQCEKEYHIGCLREQKMADLEALPKGKWFCCTDCERIHGVLQNLLTLEPEIVNEDLLTFVREKQKDKEGDKDNNVNVNTEMKFVLLSGKNATREIKPLLTQTIHIFHEGFDPIIDATSGRDFIPSMVYGRKIWSQDFAGMLCAILTVDSNVVSAGTLRVFGQDLAELPIVATSKVNQGKGYFHVLFSCIERLLSSLNIKKIVLPAADEAKSIWTKLGFETIEDQELGNLRRRCSAMMTFKGTSMLQKDIPQPQNGGEEKGIGHGDTQVLGEETGTGTDTGTGDIQVLGEDTGTGTGDVDIQVLGEDTGTGMDTGTGTGTGDGDIQVLDEDMGMGLGDGDIQVVGEE